MIMNIPENDNKKDYKDEVANHILSILAKDGCAQIYSRSCPIAPINVYIDVAKEFVKKGYYAKVVYFVESWKGVQSVHISKTPLQETNARLVYSQML